MNGLIKNFALLCFSLLLSLGIMEIAVRVMNLHEPIVWKPHPKFGWVHIPGATRLWTEEGHGLIEINDLGYRDLPRTVEKPANTIRVGVFGDSQTEAVQVHVDQTFSYLLQEQLVKSGHSIEVLNFGTNGYSPTQELLLLSKEVDRYELDVVLVGLFLDNDVSGSLAKLSVSTSGTPFIKQATGPLEFDYSQAEASTESFAKQPKAALREYLGTYRFAYKLYTTFSHKPCEGDCDNDTIPTRYELYKENPSETWTEAWAMFERSLIEIKRVTDEKNIPLVFLSIPAGQTVNQDAWSNILDMNPAMESENWQLFGPEKRLAGIASDLNVPLVQPYEKFSKHDERTTFYFGNVGHLTSKGHETITEDLYPAVLHAIESK